MDAFLEAKGSIAFQYIQAKAATCNFYQIMCKKGNKKTPRYRKTRANE